MRLPRIIGLSLALGLTLAGGVACGYQPSGKRESVVVDGSSTVFRISRAAQEAFKRGGSNVQIVVNVSGTGGGFRSYLAGKCDIVDASRAAKPEEEAKAKAQGHLAWTRFLVGHDGITVVINPKNTFVQSLTVAQLKTLWEPGSKVQTWNQLNPAWPKRKIVLYCPDTASGTFDYFTEAIVGKEKQQRTDVQASPDDNTLVNGVAGDPDGIGYFGFAYYAANTRKLKAVPIQKAAGSAPVLPSYSSIMDHSYAPLSRPLYIYVKNESMNRPGVAAFVKYYLQYVATLAKGAGYVSPTASEISENTKLAATAASAK